MTLDTTAEDAREAIRASLEGRDIFSGIPVLSHKSGDLEGLLDEIENRVGVRLVVVLLDAQERNGQTTRPDWQITLAVDCAEYVPLNQTPNGTRKGAWALAFTVVAALKLAAVRVGDTEIWPQVPDNDRVRELLATEKWNANLLVVRVPLIFDLPGIPRPTTN